ncbi:hypothetical protein HCH_05485 [Hahella chejuensis KCTC 2396]|uniref:Uncharacterized protein n=1 Tax=Hahella chejuensis (strain KCTC 2396) TaxID=349521 RepID=Q2SB26_HAHCH|nr:hypothetical protein HCH_05485 [Hahella chejuensis KCTC 2396]
MKFTLALWLLLLSLFSYSTELRVHELRNYGALHYLEFYMMEKDGVPVKAAFKALQIPKCPFNMRLVGGMSAETMNELREFYRQNYPDRLDAYLKSPAGKTGSTIKPLESVIPEALASTTLLREINEELKDRKCALGDISFEKFVPSVEDGFWVSDIYIKVVKYAE